ncbi:SycD/LcrH family type III secretion system chaperone [Castellaniella sp.]|uniref:SycD/LcrH family type III secretion system chaperone n=1 Tax=Castellaniella sp. TaxID=1955812 RepID=UPI002AFE0196|nr:SycD/LcrH family type III secretion system chaperone [Castellaniella sp.]
MSKSATADVSRSPVAQKLYDDLSALPAGSRMSSAQLEVLYALAYAHVTQGQYAQALPIFSILATYGPTRKHYLAGLAVCLEKSERYEEAISMYSLLSVLFPGSPEPALQVAECQLMLGQAGDAAEELDRVLRCIAESGGRYDALKPRAQVLRGLAGKRAS